MQQNITSGYRDQSSNDWRLGGYWGICVSYGNQCYKTASSIVKQRLGRITKLLIEVGGIICQMIFLVVDIDSYDLLLGLDFFIKIGGRWCGEGRHPGSQRTRNGSGSIAIKCGEHVVGTWKIWRGKCNTQEELFNKRMGQLQIND